MLICTRTHTHTHKLDSFGEKCAVNQINFTNFSSRMDDLLYLISSVKVSHIFASSVVVTVCCSFIQTHSMSNPSAIVIPGQLPCGISDVISQEMAIDGTNKNASK